MIKYRIDGKQYQLPEFISIEKYTKIYKVKDLFSDDYFAAKIVNIVSEAPLEDLLDGEFNEVQKLSYYVLSLIPQNKPKFIDRFTLNGVEYGFIPDWKDLTFAEFADLDTLSTKKADEILDNLHIIAAIMFRPITDINNNNIYKIEKYNIDTMKERAQLFKKELDIKYVLGAQFFFINFANKFLNSSPPYLMPNLSLWQKIKLIWMMRKFLGKTTDYKKLTDGSLSSTEFLKTILQNTKLSTKKS